MRTSWIAFLLGTLVAGLVPATLQDPVEDEREEQEEGLPPFTAFRESEARRLEQKIRGVWILTLFESAEAVIEQRDARGFANFQDGFMTLIFQGRWFQSSFLGRAPVQFAIQAGAYRYRISPQLTLQTATVMGYSNANEDRVLTFERSRQAREYTVELKEEEDELVLSHPLGHRFVFARLRATDFPPEAIEALERSRMGVVEGFASDY